MHYTGLAILAEKLRAAQVNELAGEGGLKAESGVSVIVPARNEEDNIERAVRSLAAQAGRGEILVVDDQSQDRTGEILARLRG